MEFTKQLKTFMTSQQVGIIGIASAFLIGRMFGDLIASFTQDIVMPIINPLLWKDMWQHITIANNIKIGAFVSQLISFIITLIIIFIVIEFVFNKWIIGKKPEPEVVPDKNPNLETTCQR